MYMYMYILMHLYLLKAPHYIVFLDENPHVHKLWKYKMFRKG